MAKSRKPRLSISGSMRTVGRYNASPDSQLDFLLSLARLALKPIGSCTDGSEYTITNRQLHIDIYCIDVY